jgi:hypothetical protein
MRMPKMKTTVKSLKSELENGSVTITHNNKPMGTLTKCDDNSFYMIPTGNNIGVTFKVTYEKTTKDLRAKIQSVYQQFEGKFNFKFAGIEIV